MLIDLNKNSVKITGYIAGGSLNAIYRGALVGCDPTDHYIGLYDINSTKLALIDGRKKMFLGIVGGFNAPKSKVWVGYPSKTSPKSYGVCHAPESILLFFALMTILFI
eukprot:Seg4597.2 transcript_id=Seg4597.2/GoldUCD/mRNA.D3Y31 product="hypothetical protein" protein_id=Seg4597.2/GoldUCD/D3Y31